jgi:hypothetical protein
MEVVMMAVEAAMIAIAIAIASAVAIAVDAGMARAAAAIHVARACGRDGCGAGQGNERGEDGRLQQFGSLQHSFLLDGNIEEARLRPAA